MSRSKWKKIGAFGGIAFVILQLTSQVLFQYGGAEPAFNASSQEILEFFLTRNRLFFDLGGYLSVLSFIAFLWFLGSLWATLREGEGDPAWLSWISAASGILMLATTTTTGVGWALAVFRIEGSLEAQTAQFLFDLGNFGFAMVWIWLASFLFATGVVILQSGVMPRWLAWGGIVIALGLLIARAFWAHPSMAIFMPYTLFWLWLIAASIILVRIPVSTDVQQP